MALITRILLLGALCLVALGQDAPDSAQVAPQEQDPPGSSDEAEQPQTAGESEEQDASTPATEPSDADTATEAETSTPLIKAGDLPWTILGILIIVVVFSLWIVDCIKQSRREKPVVKAHNRKNSDDFLRQEDGTYKMLVEV